MNSKSSIALILGNGPSINRLDPALLKIYPSFGCNFCPIQPTYYVCIDAHILQDHVSDIYARASRANIAYLSSKFEGTSRLYDLPYARLVSKDDGVFKAEKFMSGLTAGYVMLKLAYYAGFQKVYLWGIDHSPKWDHYRSDYHDGTIPPSKERLRVMEWHYQLAANIYARAGREIVNCSDLSRLDMIFKRETISHEETQIS